MRIAVIPNISKENALTYAKTLIEYLTSLGVTVVAADKFLCKDNGLNIMLYDSVSKAVENCDAVISLGGDGTIIRVASICAIKKKPLLGINFGRLGFVAGMEPDEKELLEKLINSNYTLEKRMVLEVSLTQNGIENTYYALNDAVISRGACSRMIDLSVELNGKSFNSFRSDGLIVATPTGSTAYSLSAGGPVIDPQMECICMVPICPHSLFSRPVILKDNSRLCIRSADCETNEVYLTIDGHENIRVFSEDRIEIKRSEHYVELIKLKDKDFYAILNEKLSERGSSRC